MSRFMKLTEDTTIRLLGLKVGDWLDIKNVQDNLATTPVQQQVQPKLEMQLPNGATISAEGVQEIIRTSTVPGVQLLVNGKLRDGVPPSLDDKRLLSRTVCSYYFFEMISQKVSIPLDARITLAKCICEAYDCLSTEDNAKPPEADWFYKNNGENKGAHTGFIQNWIVNNMKSFRTRNNKRKGSPLSTPETVAALDELEKLSCEPDNFDRAVQLIRLTFDYRNAVRSQKDCCSVLLSEYRKLLEFDGNLIQLEFSLMYPQRDDSPSPSFEQIGPLCLVLSEDYNYIACDGIKMCMTVMQYLKHQGVALHQTTDHLPPLLEDVATFVRYLQTENEDLDVYRSLSTQTGPLIVCSNMAFADGMYTVFVDGQAVSSDQNFYKILDIWFMSFHVFGFKYPVKAAPTMHFFELIRHKMKAGSRAVRVNSLVARINSSLKSLPSN